MPATIDQPSKPSPARRGGIKKPAGARAAGAARGTMSRRKKNAPPPRPTPEQSTPLGKKLIEGMEELLETMRAGGMAAVEKKFTVHRAKLIVFEKPALGKADVLAIRTALGASQPVFASLLGVSPATVRAWEQGVNAPSGMASRFLAEVRADPDYWKARLKQATGR